MMKVQVVVKNSSQPTVAISKVEANVGPADTALDFQERVAALTNTLCFPDQQLVFNGQVLPGKLCLSTAGIKDGAALELLFTATEKTLSKQLAGLIGTQNMPTEELSLLYVYRHLVSLDDALKGLGYQGKLATFLNDQKCFIFELGRVKLAEPEPQRAEVRGIIEVKVSVKVNVLGNKVAKLLSLSDDEEDGPESLRLEASDTVAKAKEIIAAAEQCPFPDRDLLFNGKKLQNGMSLNEAGVTDGAHLVMTVHASEASLASQLEELLSDRKALSPNELGLQYCLRFGTPVCQALRTLGRHGNLRRFLEGQEQFLIDGGCVTLASEAKFMTPRSSLDEDSCSNGLATCYE